MFNRNRGLWQVAAVASVSSLVAGCGILSSDSSGGKGPIVVGTTSAPSTLDPAASWDQSWELFRNIYQTLLSYPSGATTPQPDAADTCRFSDSSNRTYTCELRSGLKFSDGHTLDAHAVKYSIDRIRKINVNGGPAGLLGSLERVQVTGSPQSLQFFHDQGFAMLVVCYYDADDLDDVKRWLTVAQSWPNVRGFMYTPWLQKYDLLPAFGVLLK